MLLIGWKSPCKSWQFEHQTECDRYLASQGAVKESLPDAIFPALYEFIHPTMKFSRLLATSLVACCMLAPILPRIQAEESSSGPSSRIDPRALELLKRMSQTLGAAKAFSYRSRSVIEVPAKTGQFITLFSSADVALKRPDKLRARLGGEAPHFDFYFDGTTASAFARGGKVYSVTKTPSTVDTMLPALQQETGIRFPSAPLLFSDPYEVLTRRLISGLVVGPAVVNGAACQHLAF